jgi:hypothetical protein
VRTLKQLIFVVLCSGLCVVLCSGQEVLISPGTGTPAQNGATSVVQGKVVQDPGGQGLRKVKVTLTGGRREHYGAITDETGQFTIEGVEPRGLFCGVGAFGICVQDAQEFDGYRGTGQ